VAFGDDLKADLYYPDALGQAHKLPVVVWLHPFSYATGYSRDSTVPFASLIKRGFAVLAFDQIGFGTRVRDARDFYRDSDFDVLICTLSLCFHIGPRLDQETHF